MKEERIFKPSGTSLSNMKAGLSEYEKQVKLYRCELAFIADSFAERAVELIESGFTVAEVLFQLSGEIDFLPPDNNDCGILEKMPDILSQAAFCALIDEKLRDRNKALKISDFLKTADIPETFVYVRNSLADEAYDVFSQEFSDPRVSYADSFREAAFAVADGKAGYCILPYEESGGARISGIYDLVTKLDLKVVAITPVFGMEGNADVKYALFARDFSLPESDEDTDRYIEIRMPYRSGVSLSQFYASADFLGVSEVSINTVSKGAESEEKSYSIVFKESTDLVPFLIYLTLFVSEFTPVGVYKNIE